MKFNATIIVLILAIILLLVIGVDTVFAATYVVQDGDMSLWCIADDQGIDFWSLVLANSGPGLNPDFIRIGDVIRLP